jgi:hypothetical protein
VSKPNSLNLLALTSLQRKIIIYLTREGPADAATLAESLGRDSAEIQQNLTVLVAKGHVQIPVDGQAEVCLGYTRRRRLPARLQAALLASGRVYSAQELSALRTALPFLQFARAKLGE